MGLGKLFSAAKNYNKLFGSLVDDGYQIGFVPAFFYRVLLNPDLENLNEECSFCTTNELKEIMSYVKDRDLKYRLHKIVWEKIIMTMRRSIIYNEIVSVCSFIKEFFGFLWFRLTNRIKK